MTLAEITRIVRDRHETGAHADARFEMTAATFDRLRHARPAERAADRFGGTLGNLTGLPVVINPATPPSMWRLVDPDGRVLQEGTLDE